MDSGIRVLHVDGPERRAKTEAKLREFGEPFEFVHATDAESALAVLEREREHVDCVLSGYRLPGSNGLELVSEGRRRIAEGNAELPFLLFVADGTEAVAAAALNAGASGYVRRDRSDAHEYLAQRLEEAVAKTRSGDDADAKAAFEGCRGELAWQRERLEEFRRVVSHDLRTPLNVAQGYLAQSLDPDAGGTPGDVDALDRVTDSLDRLESFAGDLDALERQGRPVEEFEPVELAAVAESSWQRVGTGDATLRVHADGVVLGDDDRLSATFRELYRNAVEHAGPDVTVRVCDRPGGFAVEDDGPGIPDGRREDVLEAGVSERRDRTGFGLALVKHAARAHGWDVSLREGAGGGARVEFEGVDRGNRGREDGRRTGGRE
ncbi:MAG: ATP-binding protein [Haloferacaceae archaeon]